MAGALGILVVHDDPAQSVESTIPYQDSLYKHIKTPIILLSNQQGNLVWETLKNQAVFMIFKNDLGGKARNKLELEYWVGPLNHKAYKFLVQLR